ncbi:MAG: hypothetical protein QM756_32640 [Polyangiaceae bacterium]
MPQSAPYLAQVSGWQTGAPHWPATPPPPQVAGATQVAQSTLPPQPSLIGPQAVPQAVVVFGTHTVVLVPHTSCTPPPPQVSPVPQVLEQFLISPPQPSAT